MRHEHELYAPDSHEIMRPRWFSAWPVRYEIMRRGWFSALPVRYEGPFHR
jgi:hypothetical protein